MTRCLLPEESGLDEAARILRSGGVVAFPTETVYGLGASIHRPEAIDRLFAVKGRPTDNPLIVHVHDVGAVEGIVASLPEAATALARAFWPGPLTMVLEKARPISLSITAGRNSVAVRIPGHPVALELLRRSGPLAAPSANSSGRPSPTEATHVMSDLDGRIDLVLDGGACRVGLESTVLDLTATPPLVLRPGAVSPADVARVVGAVELHPSVIEPFESADARAPGMRHRHYRPDAEVVLLEGAPADVRAAVQEVLRDDPSAMVLGIDLDGLDSTRVVSYADGEAMAHDLFAAFRRCDEQRVSRVYVAAVDAEGIGLAVGNRLRKAATRIRHLGRSDRPQ